MKSNIKASDIRMAMTKRWCAPEYATMWEVADATGARQKRFADAVIMSLWPSRGLELHGVEIKVSRADWKREAADPQKAETIAQFCDRWYVHTSPGVVDDLSDLPPSWGLREFDGRVWKTVREAEKTDAVPLTRSFLASLLRRADGLMAEFIREANREAQKQIADEAQKRRDRFAKEVERAAERITDKSSRMSKSLAKFEDAFGEIANNDWMDWAKIGKAALALSECDDSGYSRLSDRLRAAADEIEAIAGIVRKDAA